MKKLGLRPSLKFIKQAIAVCGLSILAPACAFWFEQPLLAWAPIGLIGLLAGIAAMDMLLSRKAPPIATKREIPENLSVNVAQKVHIGLANRSEYELQMEIREHTPASWELIEAPADISLPSQQSVLVPYTVKPNKRGPAHIKGTELRVLSHLGYWQTSWLVEHASEHKVFPNFNAISDLAGLNGSVNLTQAGLKKFNMRGNGMDFLQLRDYRQGESLRQIDWRATSRFNKLISKEFQEEKNQHIIIMLDSGRRMNVQDDELSYFDHALNSLIMLSHTALKNGDNLSVQSFGADSRWLGQVKGAKNVGKVLNHFYDLYPEKIASDYLAAAQELQSKQTKRALVLMVSCLRDEDFSDLLKAVKLLQRKHLVAVISITEPVYEQTKERTVEHFEDALNYASSEHLSLSIEQNTQRLKQQGVICLHAPAHQLTPSVINTYLSVKRAGLL